MGKPLGHRAHTLVNTSPGKAFDYNDLNKLGDCWNPPRIQVFIY
jgi:hypothetical protein